ncbi:MAG: class II SORL domain-containing protein [Candidatus Omnitrophota bacterium]|jgi:superoxide reductase
MGKEGTKVAMAELKDMLQTADWKKEKHVPVIDSPDKVKKGDLIGKEIAHPNTTEHHIRWISVFFLPDGEKFPIQVARFEFDAHGESIGGPNMSTVYTHPAATVNFKTDKPGMILASSYCNIHGLWQGSKRLEIL